MKLRTLSAFLLGSLTAQAQLNITQVGHYDYQQARNSDLSNLWGYVDEFGNETRQVHDVK